MERFASLCMVLAMAMVMASSPAYAQISTPCNASMISSTSLSPCMSFLTNSSGNGTAPTAECCTFIKSLTSGGKDCVCLLVNGNVPFSIPINRTLAISLPRACNMPGVPLQCKSAGSPLAAPGPASFGPSLSPASTPSLSPQASSVLPSPVTPLAPQTDGTTPLATPPSQSATTGSGRTDLTPSSAVSSSHSLLSSVVLTVFGFVIFKHY